jgi:hypothetical protein
MPNYMTAEFYRCDISEVAHPHTPTCVNPYRSFPINRTNQNESSTK